MDSKRIATLSGVVVCLTALSTGSSLFVESLFNSGGVDAPGWLPTVGSLGVTVLAYSSVASILVSLLTVGVTVGFGYYLGRRIDVTREYRRLIGSVVAGGVAGTVAAGGAVYAVESLLGEEGPITASDAVVTLFGLLRAVFTSVPELAIGVFAGAALAQFRSGDRPPSPPTESGEDDSAGMAPGSRSDGSREPEPDRRSNDTTVLSRS